MFSSTRAQQQAEGNPLLGDLEKWLSDHVYQEGAELWLSAQAEDTMWPAPLRRLRGPRAVIDANMAEAHETWGGEARCLWRQL